MLIFKEFSDNCQLNYCCVIKMKLVHFILAKSGVAREITLEFCRKIKSEAQQGIQQPLAKGNILIRRLIDKI